MELICINWITILENSVSGLIAGLFIALIGIFIWKKQHLYTKKLDAYITLIPLLHYFISEIHLSRKDNYTKDIDFNSILIKEILPAVETFDFYFAEEYEYKYNGLFKQISNLYYDVSQKRIKMTNEEISQKIDPIMKEFTDVKKKLKNNFLF